MSVEVSSKGCVTEFNRRENIYSKNSISMWIYALTCLVVNAQWFHDTSIPHFDSRILKQSDKYLPLLQSSSDYLNTVAPNKSLSFKGEGLYLISQSSKCLVEIDSSSNDKTVALGECDKTNPVVIVKDEKAGEFRIKIGKNCIGSGGSDKKNQLVSSPCKFDEKSKVAASRQKWLYKKESDEMALVGLGLCLSGNPDSVVDFSECINNAASWTHFQFDQLDQSSETVSQFKSENFSQSEIDVADESEQAYISLIQIDSKDATLNDSSQEGSDFNDNESSSEFENESVSLIQSDAKLKKINESTDSDDTADDNDDIADDASSSESESAKAVSLI
eukprot:GHVL01002939.1.p1 GENE.GHVL01002939.1~~GHVL01002939.1.p1  ORF type:complete len:333 (-),score=65.57 GHVL01002939.1:1135-2133(-)